MEQIIQKIYKEFNNNIYVIIKFNNDELPKEINVKNMVFYYVNYVFYNKTKNQYFKSLSSFICIPKTKIFINNLDEFIDIIQYLKYKLEPKIIKLKQYDIEQDMKKITFNRLRHIGKMFNISGKTKKVIINYLLNLIKNHK